MQRLGMAQHCSQGLHGCSGYIVERVLLGERPTGSLTVSAQSQRLWVLRPKLSHQLGPEQTSRSQLCDFHKIVHSYPPEEGKSRSKVINRQTRFQTRTKVLQAIRKGVCQFQIRCSTCLLHVVTGDGNGIELGHILGSKSENITYQSHTGLRRIDVGISHHKLLENVILYGPRERLHGYPLLFCSDDKKC